MVFEAATRIINEAYGGNTYVDWDNIDGIEFRCSYDEDDLQDAIANGEVDDSNKDEWFNENAEFEMSFTTIDGDTSYIDSTADMFDYEGIPSEIQDLILNEFGKTREFGKDYYISDVSYTLANQMGGSVDDIAKRMFRTIDQYTQGIHGFCLKDGTWVLMPDGGDHNSISCINGVDSKYDFIEMGYPSIYDNNLRVGDELTYEQEQQIGRVARSYSDSELYVSFLKKNGREESCRYSHPRYQRVLSDIRRFYSDGIAPQGDGWG